MLDGMVDVVVGEIDPPLEGADWRTAIRERVLSARRALLRHPWASRVIETRRNPTPTVIGYMDEMIGILRRGGFSVDLTHHAMHAMGSRLLGFSQELFDDTPDNPPEIQAIMAQQMAEAYQYISELAAAISHDDASVVGQGCDDQFEFEFALGSDARGARATARESLTKRAGAVNRIVDSRLRGPSCREWCFHKSASSPDQREQGRMCR